MKTKLYRVRCCCTPRKVLGYLEGPAMEHDGEFLAPQRTDDVTDAIFEMTVKLQPVKVRAFQNNVGKEYEYAIYSEDRGVDFWRTIIGFEEAADRRVVQDLQAVARIASQSPLTSVGFMVEHLLAKDSVAREERDRLDRARPAHGIITYKRDDAAMERLQGSDTERDIEATRRRHEELREQFQQQHTPRSEWQQIVDTWRAVCEAVRGMVCNAWHVGELVQTSRGRVRYCRACSRVWEQDVDGWTRSEFEADLLKEIAKPKAPAAASSARESTGIRRDDVGMLYCKHGDKLFADGCEKCRKAKP